MAMSTMRRGLNPGYASRIVDTQSKERYSEELRLVNDKVLEEQWEDDTDKWPAVTYVHVCLY